MPQNRKVLLTFDDGPSLYTTQILDILKKEKIKATFFFLGKNILKYPEIAKRAYREKHTIANHGQNHDPLTSRLGLTFGQIEKTQKLIEKIDPKSKKLFRPPYGFLKNPFLKSKIKKAGYKIVLFDIVGFDWKPKITSIQIVKNIISQLNNGQIILLHDGFGHHETGDRSKTVEALPQIIKYLKEEEYIFQNP